MFTEDGKAVALRPRPQELNEPKGDVRFRSNTPQPGRMLTQHTGLPPRVTGSGPGAKSKPAGNGKAFKKAR